MTSRVEVLGLSVSSATRRAAIARLAAAMATLPERASSMRLSFTDENGPKGGAAVRCALTVTLAGWGRLHVEDRATTPRLALDGALDRLQRRLARRRGIERDSSRRPKKYYAAARELEGAAGPGTAGRRRRRRRVS
jgi:ribosome-associated translation inhibitor RaiA